MEPADVTSGASALTAEQRSQASHWRGFVKWMGPCHLKPPTLFLIGRIGIFLFFFFTPNILILSSLSASA